MNGVWKESMILEASTQGWGNMSSQFAFLSWDYMLLTWLLKLWELHLGSNLTVLLSDHGSCRGLSVDEPNLLRVHGKLNKPQSRSLVFGLTLPTRRNLIRRFYLVLQAQGHWWNLHSVYFREEWKESDFGSYINTEGPWDQLLEKAHMQSF